MAHAHCMLIPKAAQALSEYGTLIAFPQQQWLHEGSSVIHYTYIVFLFKWCTKKHSVSQHIYTFSKLLVSVFSCNIPVVLDKYEVAGVVQSNTTNIIWCTTSYYISCVRLHYPCTFVLVSALLTSHHQTFLFNKSRLAKIIPSYRIDISFLQNTRHQI